MTNEVNQKFMADLALTKLAPYLYKVNFPNWDYSIGSDFYEKYHNSIITGSCSAISKGDFFGRNFDSIYDECASFVVQCKQSKFRNGSIGIAGGNTELTEAIANSANYNPAYKLLPFMTVDGINDYGVACCVNTVPTGDKGNTTGSNPTGKDMCATMIVRYLLDYAKSAENAIELIKRLNVFMPISNDFTKEYHWMISDKNKTYVVEYVHNTINVISDVTGDGCGSFYDNQPIMTNFYLSGFDGNTSTRFNNSNSFNAVTTKLTKYAAGIERFNILSAGYSSITGKETMLQLMKSVNYSKAYENTTNPFWYSEYLGDYSDDGYSDLSINSQTADFQSIVVNTQTSYANKQRNGTLKQTVHTSIYDLKDILLFVYPQESETQFEFSLKKHNANDNPYVGDEEGINYNNLVLSNVFNSAMRRENKIVELKTTGETFKCFFRKINDNTNQRDTMTMYYNADAPVSVGSLLSFENKSFIVLNKETAENNIYRKSAVIKTNGTINTHSLSVSGLAFYGDNVNNATASNTLQLSTIDGNIELLTEDCAKSRNLQVNDLFNEWGRTWQISNLFYVDGICHIIAEVHSDVVPTYNYSLVLSALTSLNVEPDDTDSISVTALINGNTVESPTITFSSSNPNVATIDTNGNIVYLADGEVAFTALWAAHNISQTTDTVTVLSAAVNDTVAIYVDTLDEICYDFPETLHYYATRGGVRDDTIPVSFKIENLSVSGTSYYNRISVTDNGNGTVDVGVSGSVMRSKTFDFVAYNTEFNAENRQNIKVVSLF